MFKENLGPLIDTEMTRCIQCTRCVRFGEEIAGMRELGVTFRGEHEQIGTYVKHMIQSEVSGNVIDLCPVGALTAKPSRYSLRGWEMREHPAIAAHDCVGSNIYIHTRSQEYAPQRVVMRVVPRENAAINETWMSDRDRFSYIGLKHPDRILKPRVKRNGEWQDIEWPRALLEIADRTLAIVEQQGADQIAALVSPNSTMEECYLMQKWLRAFGSSNIDHRIRQQDFSDQRAMPEFPNLGGMKIADLESLQAVLLIGSHIRYEQPLLGLRLNKAAQDGALMMAINPMDYRFVFSLSEKIITADIVGALSEVAAAVAQLTHQQAPELDHIQSSEEAKSIARRLIQMGKKSAIFIGEYGLGHPEAALIRALTRYISHWTQSTLSILTDGANSAGAWLAGAIPHRGPASTHLDKTGADAFALLTKNPKRAYFLLGIEPEHDCAAPAAALKSLQDAGLVVCLTPFTTPTMESYADFILPITPPTEMAGTFVNIEGAWQSFAPVSVPNGEAKPAWKICRVLANLMELPGFDYNDIHEVQLELKTLVGNRQIDQQLEVSLPSIPFFHKNLTRLAPWLMYRVDGTVRRSQALQDTMHDKLAHIAVHPDLAAKLNFKVGQRVIARQAQSQITLPLRTDPRLALDVVFIPCALAETAGFGQASAPITLQEAVTHE